MRARGMLAVALLIAGGADVRAAELVGVRGSDTRYTATMDATAGGKTVKMTLTGVALRQRFFLNVYAIGSYVQADAGVRTPEDLAGRDCVKRLHLVMERTVEGKDMAEAFQAAVRLNYPAPAFAAEVAQLGQMLRAQTAARGDHIFLTHLPGVGLHCLMPGKADFVIRNVQFSRAIWNIYLGRNNLGEAIKKGLVSRL